MSIRCLGFSVWTGVTLSDITFELNHLTSFLQDSFGWCTWDAFYHQVSGWGIERGLRELAAGGAPVKLLIIDDGWQDTASSAELKASACPHTNNAFKSWIFKAATFCVGKVDAFLSR